MAVLPPPFDIVALVLILGLPILVAVHIFRPRMVLPVPGPGYRSSAIRRYDPSSGWVAYTQREPGPYTYLRRADIIRHGRSLRVIYGFRPVRTADGRWKHVPEIQEVRERTR